MGDIETRKDAIRDIVTKVLILNKQNASPTIVVGDIEKSYPLDDTCHYVGLAGDFLKAVSDYVENFQVEEEEEFKDIGVLGDIFKVYSRHGALVVETDIQPIYRTIIFRPDLM